MNDQNCKYINKFMLSKIYILGFNGMNRSLKMYLN